jgi:hypothetical protein
MYLSRHEYERSGKKIEAVRAESGKTAIAGLDTA